ncbi:MAG: seg [candidate division WS6 bacterium 36_33]|uniref:Seg n=1 Tax=candidate division WS6 bacterium 36_33 TaxID=1641388 RepID=A0A101GZG3_9BACT|nr:MAG: seg [candidate division WS6 bacterium 36_33]
MYIAHGPISYLVNEAIQSKKIKHLKMSEQILVALCALLFGILPDFDIFLLSMLSVPRFIHHGVITHTPIFYIGIWVILKGLICIKGKFLNKKTNKALDNNLSHILANTFLIGTLFHLFADFIVDSIMLAYPVSKDKFYLIKYIFEPNLFASFPFSVMDSIEIFFIALFVYALYKKFIKKSRLVNISLKILVLVGMLYIPLTIWASSNTYNRSYLREEKNEVVQDIDYDGISDGQDPDVGNTKEDNLEKVDSEQLFTEAEGIITSGKWTNQDNNALIAETKDSLGGFSSYRIISQAHYNLRLPIEPVLRDYHIKKYGFESYFYSDYEYPTLLFEYLEEKGMLEEIQVDEDTRITPGKIFFLVERISNNIDEGSNREKSQQELNILNLGITLEENYLATVLEGDKHLTKHTYGEVNQVYKEEFMLYIQK